MLIFEIAIGVALGIGLTKMTRHDWKKLAFFVMLLVTLSVGVVMPIFTFQLQRGVDVPLMWKVSGIALWCLVLSGIVVLLKWIGNSMTD